MKKIVKVLPLVLALMGMFTFSACDKQESQFEIVLLTGYVIQDNGEDPENPSFGLYLQFMVTNGEMVQASITKQGTSQELQGVWFSPVEYDIIPEFYSSLEEIYGIYEATAISKLAEVATATITISSNTVKGKMGELIVEDFKYENGKLSAKFNKVTNADKYAFYLNPVISGVTENTRLAANILYPQLSEEMTEYSDYFEVTIALDLSDAISQLQYVRVYPVVTMRGSPMLLFGKERIIQNGADSFS